MKTKDKTIEEVLSIKKKAEQQIFIILKTLEEETGLIVMGVTKRTTAGGRLDPWCSTDIKLDLPR